MDIKQIADSINAKLDLLGDQNYRVTDELALVIYNSNIKVLKVPNGVRTLDVDGMIDCPHVRELVIPKSVEDIQTGIF